MRHLDLHVYGGLEILNRCNYGERTCAGWYNTRTRYMSQWCIPVYIHVAGLAC